METQIKKNVLNVIQTSGNVRHDVLNVSEVSRKQAMATCAAKQQSFQDPSHSNLQSLGVRASPWSCASSSNTPKLVW